jgi:hypothetical protein
MKSSTAFFFVTACAMLALAPVAGAQNRFIKHEVFAIDSIKVLRLDLVDAYAPIIWDGNTVMIKTEVRLYNGSEGILEHFLKSGRYGFVPDTSLVGEMLISSADKKRQAIRTAKGECFEAIDVEVYIPDTFAKQEEHIWVRREEDHKE